MNSFRTFLLIAVVVLVGGAAHAQWQWTDKEGHKVFSDRAPPPDVPAKNILKQPGINVPGIDSAASTTPAKAASAPNLTNSDAAPKTDVPKLSGVDKELADKKKLADAAVIAKTKADEEQTAKARAANCQRARNNKVVMDSGVRVSQTNAQGERAVMDDAARAAESKRIQTAIDASCK
jgi:hypothetical protein